MAIKEIRVINDLSERLGPDYARGALVIITEGIRNVGDLVDLGIKSKTSNDNIGGFERVLVENGYINCALVGQGEGARVFYGTCAKHEFLEAALVTEYGCQPEEIRYGQVGFMSSVFYTINLHQPLSEERQAREAEMRKLIKGIDRAFWDEQVGINDGSRRVMGYRKANDELVF